MDDARIFSRVLLLGVAPFFLSFVGCQSFTRTQAGTLIGTGIGGLAGGAIGNRSGNTAAGALIGAASGGLLGALAGNAADSNEQRDRAQRDLQIARSQAAAQALTNFDLIKLTTNGVSEDIIIESVRVRGGRFDLSPESIIALKQSGVSDRVILAAQQAPRVPDGAQMTYPSGETTVVRSSPEVLVVPSIVFGPRYWWGPPHSFHHRRHFGPRPW